MSKDLPDWAVGCINKHSTDAVRVILDILEAGLKRGEVSSNDVSLATRERFAQPKVIGAIMKSCMHGMGFKQKTVHASGGKTYYLMLKSNVEKAHGRMVAVWELSDHLDALKARRKFSDMITYNDQPKQGELL